MLGPALAHLFVDLDKRQDKLTGYEKALHGELFVAMQMSRLAMLQRAVGASPGHSVPEDVLGSFALDAADHRSEYARIAKEVTDSFWTKIDLSGGGGWTGDPKLQINCPRKDCPNKDRTQ